MRYVVTLLATCGLLLAPGLLPHAGEPVCAWCFDGPEMFQHVEPKDAEPVITSIKCAGPIAMTYGKANWLVAECGYGTLVISPGPKNRSFGFFMSVDNKGRNQLSGERPRERRARAAYDELQSLGANQVDALLRDVRAGTSQ